MKIRYGQENSRNECGIPQFDPSHLFPLASFYNFRCQPILVGYGVWWFVHWQIRRTFSKNQRWSALFSWLLRRLKTHSLCCTRSWKPNKNDKNYSVVPCCPGSTFFWKKTWWETSPMPKRTVDADKTKSRIEDILLAIAELIFSLFCKILCFSAFNVSLILTKPSFFTNFTKPYLFDVFSILAIPVQCQIKIALRCPLRSECCTAFRSIQFTCCGRSALHFELSKISWWKGDSCAKWDL